MLIRLLQALGVASILLAILYATFPTAEFNGTIVAIWLIGAVWAVSHYVFLTLSKSRRWSTPTIVIGDG
ncbi:MAG: hypothetical protein ACRD28_12760, partial [Acidobacteriaceae bacterium]